MLLSLELLQKSISDARNAKNAETQTLDNSDGSAADVQFNGSNSAVASQAALSPRVGLMLALSFAFVSPIALLVASAMGVGENNLVAAILQVFFFLTDLTH
jgi:hypothetical protein